MRKIKSFVALLLAIIISVSSVVVIYAEAENTSETTGIITNSSVEDDVAHVWGTIAGADENNIVTILVGDFNNIVYVNQKFCNEDGSFKFVFPISEKIASGTYPYRIGSDADQGVANGEISLTITEDIQFVDVDLNVNILAYTPTVSGAIRILEGTHAVLEIINTTNETIITQKTINKGEGSNNLSFTLPSLARNIKYAVSLTCYDGDEILFSSTVNINSSILKVTIIGSISLGENVIIDGCCKSTNAGWIDNGIVITESKRINTTIPNIALHSSFDLLLDGVIRRVIREPITSKETVVYNISGEGGDVAYIAPNVENFQSFSGKIFELNYNPSQIRISNLCATIDETVTQAGIYGPVQVVSVEEGKIKFTSNVISPINGMLWSGVMNVFEFEFLPDYTGDSVITLTMQ